VNRISQKAIIRRCGLCSAQNWPIGTYGLRHLIWRHGYYPHSGFVSMLFLVTVVRIRCRMLWIIAIMNFIYAPLMIFLRNPPGKDEKQVTWFSRTNLIEKSKYFLIKVSGLLIGQIPHQIEKIFPSSPVRNLYYRANFPDTITLGKVYDRAGAYVGLHDHVIRRCGW